MKKIFYSEEYVAPALDVVSATVEAGFAPSGGYNGIIDVTPEYDYDENGEDY